MAASKTIFISYGREPEVIAFVRKLKGDIEESGLRVWLDMDDIPAGSEWPNEIGLALKSCTALIAVVTAKYVSSKYCKEELYFANSNSKSVYPVIYDDEKLWKNSLHGAGVELVIGPTNWSMFRPDKDDYGISLSKLLRALRAEHGISLSDSNDGMIT